MEDRRSTSSHCVSFGGNLVQWSSKKQKVVAFFLLNLSIEHSTKSPTEIVWSNHLLSKLQIVCVNNATVLYDNQGAGFLAGNPILHSHTIHIEIDVHHVSEQLASEFLEVHYVRSDFQVAEIFTRSLSLTKFSLLRSKLNLTEKVITWVGQVGLCAGLVWQYLCADLSFGSVEVKLCQTLSGVICSLLIYTFNYRGKKQKLNLTEKVITWVVWISLCKCTNWLKNLLTIIYVYALFGLENLLAILSVCVLIDQKSLLTNED